MNMTCKIVINSLTHCIKLLDNDYTTMGKEINVNNFPDLAVSFFISIGSKFQYRGV